MRKFIGVFSSAALLASLLAAATAPSVGAVTCTPTGYWRDGINLTAAQIGGDVTVPLDATGCNIGVYYNATNTGNVTGAEIYGANYFGVLVNGGNVNVTGSSIHDIGDSPLSGAQHGVAIYYATVVAGPDGSDADTDPDAMVCGGDGATSGTIDGNAIFAYQKGGIVANCAGTFVAIADNTVTGASSVSYIAQNGIQLGYHAAGSVTGNLIDGNSYTGSGWVATGLLLFDVSAKDIKASQNMYRNNQMNLVLVTDEACPSMYGGFYDTYGLCL